MDPPLFPHHVELFEEVDGHENSSPSKRADIGVIGMG
jgi:hypothetical protein